ncbi:hypothetical protein OS493_001968 [Desmophyllum pertusum]|uniref:Uncharacterized protein n=1 Tax=Desmophyllum pertusum TaxID=174260 RepID=A0A9X0CVT5_9CNID|nr:hypothetical protein OS493_001968 [Desmophyllum pertusum]
MSFGGIGEHLKRRTSVSSVGTLLRRTVRDVLDPLLEMSSKIPHEAEKESACFSTLLLQHALGELELFLNKFKIVEEDSEATKIVPSIVWSDEINDFVPAKTSEEMISILSKDRGRLSYLKSALCIQNIRSALLKNKELHQEAEVCELKGLVSIVCSSVSDVAACSASWDRQEQSISQENAPVALWDLISRDAVVLFPLCTADQQLQMAHLLIKTITRIHKWRNKHNQGVSLCQAQSVLFWGRLKQAIDCKCSANSLGERLMKALSDIATPEFSNIGILKETSDNDDDDEDDDDDDEEMDADNEQHADESSDEDSDGDEEDLEKETRTSDKQCVGNLQTFRTHGL